MGDARVSEVLSYTEDIQPYRFIQLYAGVGSGKNYFIEQLMKGFTETRKDGSKVEIEPQTVLLITSRRAKVDETLTDEDLPADGKIGRWEEHHIVRDDNGDIPEPHGKLRILKDEWGTHRVYQRSVVCTNAFIERYLQYRYNPQDITTHLWELFDIIVIDEVHSLVMDATYQSAPFYVRELVNHFLRKHGRSRKQPEKFQAPLCKHMILMTGSPDPIADFQEPKNSITIDKFDDCRNVVPQNIYFISSEDVKAQIAAQVQNGEGVLYFSNHVVLPGAFCEDTDISPECVAVSFSDKTKREKLSKASPEVFRTMQRVENSLMEESLIPDDVKIFVTTSRNKEGINIDNRNFKHLYVESHIRSDVIQMAGRIRSGVENMYLVVDAGGHGKSDWVLDKDFSQMKIAGNASKPADVCGAANEYLESLCLKHKVAHLYKKGESAQTTVFSKGNEPLAAFVNYIHEKFPFIRYSYFRNVFEFYTFRVTGLKYQEKYQDIFEKAKNNPSIYQRTLQEWFPASEVFPYVTLDERAQQYFDQMGLADEAKRYTDEEIGEIMTALNVIYGTEITQINSLLGRFTDYKCKRCSNNKQSPAYEQYRFKRG